MGAITAKIAGNSANSPATGSVTLGDLAPLAANSVIGNTTGSAATPTAVPTSTFVAATSLLRSYLASTVTYNNVDVLANTALSVTVATGGQYAVELWIFTTNVARVPQVAFGGTAVLSSAVGAWDAGGSNDPLTAGSLSVTDVTTPFSEDTLDGGGGTQRYIFRGSIAITTGGTFLLQGAQYAANASNTTILAGSTLILTKMN